MYLIKLTFIVVLLLLFSPTIEAKKRCKPLLEKLHNIQAMQRNGYSSSRGASLRGREDKARDRWWQCETGRNKSKNKKKSKKKATSKKSGYRRNVKSIKNKRIKAGTPFKTSNTIVIKSKYQGDKKRAWLAFYEQPKRCQQPKNLQIFAFCSENKQTQRKGFEKEYNK